MRELFFVSFCYFIYCNFYIRYIFTCCRHKTPCFLIKFSNYLYPFSQKDIRMFKLPYSILKFFFLSIFNKMCYSWEWILNNGLIFARIAGILRNTAPTVLLYLFNASVIQKLEPCAYFNSNQVSENSTVQLRFEHFLSLFKVSCWLHFTGRHHSNKHLLLYVCCYFLHKSIRSNCCCIININYLCWSELCTRLLCFSNSYNKFCFDGKSYTRNSLVI